jgi:hypothetical protein
MFWSPTGKKRLVFSSNGRIRIQTVKFQFKRTNDEPPRHYRPAAGGSAGGTAPPSGPAATSSRAGGSARPLGGSI